MVSFLVKARDASQTLKRALKSIVDVCTAVNFDNFEIVVVIHLCVDNTEQIARAFQKEYPHVDMRVIHYKVEVSRPGVATFVTPPDNKHSLATYYTFCWKLCRGLHRFKFDSDMVLSLPLAMYMKNNLSRLTSH